MSDDYPSAAEQAAFSAAHDLIENLKADARYDPIDIGKGVMVAAVSCLRKALPSEEVAKLFYELADDYATRGRDDGR